MDINTIPASIPASRDKEKLLQEQGIESLYLGQGLMFVPSSSSNKPYNEYLKSNGFDPAEFPLEIIQKKIEQGAVYTSPRADEILQEISQEKFAETYVPSVAFDNFIKEKSSNTFETLFKISQEKITTFQVDNLATALSALQKIIPKLYGKPVTQIMLPAKYKYSGHTDFTNSAQEIGLDMEVVNIPAIEIDGNQDLENLKKSFEETRTAGKIAIMIDQESNNNASGFDRNPKLNSKLSNLLKEYQDCIAYLGDVAYKGMKEDILEPYDLMQTLEKDKVNAFYYTSFSKLTNYRSNPSFKNFLTGVAGDKFSQENLAQAFTGIQRAMGLGCSPEGAILANKLVKDEKFLQEVRVLNKYLQYVRDTMFSSLQKNNMNNLAEIFNPQTAGIFRCVDDKTAEKLNSGNDQVITVGTRINIWPLGDPANLEKFLQALK
jgi:aspartate/tyrosine/aromatic aminotransferase